MIDKLVKYSIKNGDFGFVVLVLFVNSGVVIYVLCELCRVLFLGCCSYIVGVLFLILDYIKKYGLI